MPDTDSFVFPNFARPLSPRAVGPLNVRRDRDEQPSDHL